MKTSAVRKLFANPLGHPVRNLILLSSLGLVAVGIGYSVVTEMTSSEVQASYLAGLGRKFEFHRGTGPSTLIRFPRSGPYDKRLGYDLITGFTERLAARNYFISEQARVSPWLAAVHDAGLYAPYREKTQAGLELNDADGLPLYAARFPERVYDRFEAVPPLVVAALLFIENRELLDGEFPRRNPAVEWTRFAKAVIDQLWHVVDKAHMGTGGSTLATQIEKYRHSPGGLTSSAREKLRQMASASLRAYLDGESTLEGRRQIVVDYLNSVPLYAKAGYGEINGLGDGLWAWYGTDFAALNRNLQEVALVGEEPTVPLEQRALSFKQALSLIIAQRHPTYYLNSRMDDLEPVTDRHLRLLEGAGIITPAFRDAALQAKLTLHQGPVRKPARSFVNRKADTVLRRQLAAMLNVPRRYDLDRLDLAVASTLNGAAERVVTDALQALKQRKSAMQDGLYGGHMLAPRDDLNRLVFSFTLFERGEHANLVRVQTDNFDQPFDINDGARLDLGSTAKLRTLITYLELITELHSQYAEQNPSELARIGANHPDVLARWAAGYLAAAQDRSLRPMLEAAMERRYSANPGEAFYTGGGRHNFSNFDKDDDHRIVTVREAFRRSVNLAFVRLMRDVARHYSASPLHDADDPKRREYLVRFADQEGQEFLVRFYQKYAGKTPDEAEDLLLDRVRAAPQPLATLFRSLAPERDLAQFSSFMRAQLPNERWSERSLQELFAGYGPDKFSLNDRGYIAHVHPLELWLVGFLRHHPGATLKEALDASRDERQQAYAWLFKTRHKDAQDKRIHNLLELDAFERIGRSWQRLGYPFANITPSYATAVGASGDRPAALAELMGIIVNNGLRLPTVKITGLHFAGGTPFETHMTYAPGESERVLPPEITDVVRHALVDVVQGGTAQRLNGAFRRDDGSMVQVGGKTGTGEQRFVTFGRGGDITSSKVVNRSATFVFFIGERFFGTVTAYVHEPYAANYNFTSTLTVQLLKSLAPTLMPLLEREQPRPRLQVAKLE